MSNPVPSSDDWVDDPIADRVFQTVFESVPAIRQALIDLRDFVDRRNPSGEQIRAADEFADDRLEERLLAIDGVASYASEEQADDVTAKNTGEYHLAVDPLDGSSNLKSNNPMGTIVGIYDEPLPTSGRNLVAAGYVLYGPNATMMITDGETVTEYLVSEGERRLLDEDVTIPDDPVVYGVGGRRPDWPDDVTDFVESMESDRLKLRYGGALIADVTQVLTHGGLFSYPELDGRPEGKLRYQFECAPIGYIVETAGGRVSNGARSLLDYTPDRLHERTPFYVGNPKLVARRERY
jgi:fructose-1,6-bisphosphatase I